MPTLVFLILALAGAAARSQPARSDPRDILVYRAVRAATIKPEADAAHVLTFDRTLAICRTPSDQLKERCLEDEAVVQVFERQLPRMPKQLFAGALSDSSRQELAHAFRQRNMSSELVPVGLEGLIGAAAEDFDVKRQRPVRGTLRVFTFSLPAYSSDGHGLVYGEYFCGRLCATGWLFLLRSKGETWEVVGTEVLWVS